MENPGQQQVNGTNLRTVSSRRFAESMNRVVGRKKTPEDRNLDNALLEKGSVNSYITLNFLFTLWVFFAHMFVTLCMFYPEHLHKRCMIPSLEGEFTDKQIAQITEEEMYPCTCPDLNYTELVLKCNYSFPEIMYRIHQIRNVKRIPCKKLKDYYVRHNSDGVNQTFPYEELYSLKAYYNSYCTSHSKKIALSASTNTGLLITGIPLGVLSDLYGRKISYLVSYLLSFLGILTLFGPNEWFYALGRLLLGTGLVQEVLFLILFIEKCSVKSRRYFGYIIFAVRPLTGIIVLCLLDALQVYTIRLMCAAVALSTVAFIYWWVPESARWLYYTGNQQKSWSQLVAKEKLPPDFATMANKGHRPSLRNHFLFYTNFVYKLRTVKVIGLVYASSSCFVFDRNLRISQPSNVFIKGHLSLDAILIIIIVIVSHLAIMQLSYKKVLVVLYIFITLLNGVFLIQRDIPVHLDAVVPAFGFSAQYLILYQVMENFPTSQRGTTLGICMSVIGFSNAIPIYLNEFDTSRRDIYFYLYTFTFAVVCTILSCFSQDMRHYNLPDIFKEALMVDLVNFC